MAGVVFPDIANALMPLMQMDRQREAMDYERERNTRLDAQRAQDRADNLAFRKEEADYRREALNEQRAMRIQSHMATMDEKKRAMVQEFAKFRVGAGGAVLNAPPEQRPQAYAMYRQAAKERGYDMSLFPEQWDASTERRLQFDVDQSIPWADQPRPMPSVGGAPAPGGTDLDRSRMAISGIESGGKYDALGPMTGGDRAYGRYQVMGKNIPEWTQAALGQPMTPQEFLANPQAQDAVFNHRFGQYIQKYGSPEAASRAWFAGEGGMNNPDAKDVLGTSVAGYGQKFAQAGGFTPTNVPAQSVPGALPQVAQGDAIAGQGDVMAPPRAAPLLTPQDSVTDDLGLLTRSGYVRAGRNNVQLKGPTGGYLYMDPRSGNTIEYKPREPEKAPSGYRNVPGGRQEIIPGGPADVAAQENRAKGEQAASKQSTEQANKLRDDFKSEPVVKSYRVVVPMLESAKDAATRPTRAADLSLIYAFAKLMDPESVVRESEAGMVSATGTIGDRLNAYIGQMNGGPMLQPETRKRLIAELDSRFRAIDASYQELATAYGEIADANGIKRSHVILPIRKPKEAEAPSADGGGLPSMSDIDAELQRRSMGKK